MPGLSFSFSTTLQRNRRIICFRTENEFALPSVSHFNFSFATRSITTTNTATSSAMAAATPQPAARMPAPPREQEVEAPRRLPPVMRVVRRGSRSTGENRGRQVVVATRQVLRELDGATRTSRKIPKSKGASGTLKKLAAKAEIIKSLECPVCYNIPIPPIIHCKGGHITCGPCRLKLENCGLCKKPFSLTRNYPVEAIINSCHFSCPYDEDGCTEEITGEAYTHHSETCEFRKIICNESRFFPCEFESVPYGMYWQHLKTNHRLKTKVVFFDDYTFLDLTIPTSSSATSKADIDASNDKYLIEIANTNHKFILKGVHSNGTFQFWIGYFGGAEEINFKATLCVGSVCNRESKISWTMSVSSFRKSLDELEEVGTVKDSFMKKIAKDSGNGVYKFQLFCKIENIDRGSP